MSEQCDVMISLHVGSMAQSAGQLKTYLEELGLKVWICTVDLGGGEDFRDSIVEAVKSAKVFLPLINEEWALSGECKDEYNLAKRLNLTSHERGRTDRKDHRLPIIMPIAFSGLRWDAHSHVELLAANTNFIVHDKETLECGRVEPTMNAVALSMASYGIDVQLPESLKNQSMVGKVARQQASAEVSSVASFGQQEERLDSALGIIQSLQSTLQQLRLGQKELELQSKQPRQTGGAGAGGVGPVGMSVGPNQQQAIKKQQEQEDEPVRIPKALDVDTKYFGTTSDAGEMGDGHEYQSWSSCELSITRVEGESVSCELVRTELRKTVDGNSEPDRDPPLPEYLSGYLKNLGSARMIASGTFDASSGLLMVTIDEIETLVETENTLWPKGKYYLTVFNEYVAGTIFNEFDDDDGSDTSKPGSLILRRF